MIISPYITAVFYAWIIAQGAKYIIGAVRRGGFRANLRQLYLSGNMPSAHSSSVVALLVTVGVIDGVTSGIFAITTLFSAIVMYDAVMVRRSSGEQGSVLRQLLQDTRSKLPVPFIAKGHTPLEVVVGAFLGAIVGYIVILTI